MQSTVPQIGSAGRTRHLAAGLRAAWRSGILELPCLDRLRDDARHLASETGGGPWLDAHDRLIDSLNSEARLNEVGLTFAFVQLSRLLRQRRRAHRLWQDQPDIAAVPILRPVIVMGHMRSGTTRLQRLLGCDPGLNHTRFFEVMNPVRPAFDWRVVESWAQLKLLGLLNPTIDAVHPSSPCAVEEVFGMLGFSFYGAQFEAQWRVPGFARYWEGQDRTWVYREFKLLLQTIAWQRGAPEQPWVLKAPQFMEDLAPLLDVFPDARLVCLHRNPNEIVGSTASLFWNQMQVQSDAVDRDWIGAECLRKTARREAICRDVRLNRPDVPQIDVAFDAVNADWAGEMRRLYGFLGQDLTPATAGRMDQYLNRAEASGFRGHRYRSTDFGLDPHAIARSFGSGGRPLPAG